MAQTIVMIHGMWGGEWCWDHYKTYFEKRGYGCITPTLRYHDVNPDDEPDPRLGTISLIEYADDLEKLIRKLDVPVILMGHSMGGLLAQILASRNLADALVLLTPASPYGIMALTPSVVRSFWSTLTTWGFWKKPGRPTFKEASYSTFGKLPADKQKEKFNRFVYESGRAAYEIGFWYLDSRKASKVDESEVTCPVLVIGGTEDKLTPASVVRKVANKYKAVAVYKEFANHGHWILEEPGWQEIAKYTSDWLDKLEILKKSEVEVHTEQRKYKRTPYQALISFSQSESDSYHQGQVSNYSQGGLHFTSKVEIEPGSEITIKWIDSVPIIIGSEKMDVCKAEVTWYKHSKDKSLYDIGVQFPEIAAH